MDLTKSYIFDGNPFANLQTAFKLDAAERNTHHKRARWMGGLAVLCMIFIVTFPIGLLLLPFAAREANKAEQKRQSANG